MARRVIELKIQDGQLSVRYNNGDFTFAALDIENAAALLEDHLDVINTEIHQGNVDENRI